MENMDLLVQAMSDADLQALLDKYPDNPEIQKLVNGILEVRGKAAEQAKVKAKFESGIAKLFDKLPRPEDIYNVYARWSKVDVPDGEATEVELVDASGNVVTEMRQLSHEEYQWVVEVNHADKLSKGGSSGSASEGNKRAITVLKRDGLALNKVGSFSNASAACKHLHLMTGGDSAIRVLQRNGYTADTYKPEDGQVTIDS